MSEWEKWQHGGWVLDGQCCAGSGKVYNMTGAPEGQTVDLPRAPLGHDGDVIGMGLIFDPSTSVFHNAVVLKCGTKAKLSLQRSIEALPPTETWTLWIQLNYRARRKRVAA